MQAVNEGLLLRDIYRRGDQWMARFMVLHLGIAAALAPFHGTWIATLGIGGGAALAFFLCMWRWPGQLVTRMVAGLSLQAFCALHIFQMAGLAEMHFFFFTSVTAMIIYQDWRAFWPGVWAIIVQHTVFCHLHNHGIHPGGLPFFEPQYVSPLRMTFHYGIALGQVVIASYWAHVLRQQTLRDASQRAELERANVLLQDQQAELGIANEHLQENAAQLEEANEELRESEQRFRSTFDQAAVGVAHVGLDGRWLQVNDRLSEIVGYSMEELLRLTFQEITHREDLEADLDSVRRLLAAEIPTYSMEKRYRRKDGSPVWTNLTVSLVRHANGEPRYFIAVIEDVDARKRAEAERDALHARERAARMEAETANQAKGQFLAAMSHELRTPLNAVAGYVDLMELGIHGPVTETQFQALGRIRQNGNHLLSLINDILHFAKIEAGKIEYNIADVPLAEVLVELEGIIEPQVHAAGLTYTVHDSDPALRLRGDPERTRQVLLNLLGNAIKFTPAGGRIEISCDGDGGWVHVRVRDTGQGIPAEMVQRIFDPFVQVRDSQPRDSSRQGTGLGLAISRDLAQAMGGDLTVESTLGQGSTFALSLPAAGQEDGERRSDEDRYAETAATQSGASIPAYSPGSAPPPPRGSCTGYPLQNGTSLANEFSGTPGHSVVLAATLAHHGRAANEPDRGSGRRGRRGTARGGTLGPAGDL